VRRRRRDTLLVLGLHLATVPVLALACGRIASEETSADAGDAGGAHWDVSHSDRDAQPGSEIDYDSSYGTLLGVEDGG
jgi:hypothetical protein